MEVEAEADQEEEAFREELQLEEEVSNAEEALAEEAVVHSLALSALSSWLSLVKPSLGPPIVDLMETFRVKPGRGVLNHYSLDTPVNIVLKELREKSTKLPSIKLIDNSQSKRIYIQVGPVFLIFDAYSQRLKVIELDLVPDESNRYKIELEGIVYMDFQELCANLNGPCKSVQLSDYCHLYSYSGLSLVVNSGVPTKLLIHLGDSLPKTWSASGDHFSADVVVELDNKRISVIKGGASHTLEFGQFPEDFYDSLGAPEQVKYICHGIVYSYFHLGIDVIFAAETHGMERITLHTNFPDHLLFKEYNRCLFEIRTEGSTHSLNPLSTWEAVQEFMSSSARTEESKPILKQWKFGVAATTVHVYNGVAFEVLNSGRIGSVSFCPSW